MKTLTSSLFLLDPRSAHDFPVSSTTPTYLHATLSASFRQTRRGRKHNASSPPLSSTFSSSGSLIRKPPDRNGNGFLFSFPSPSKSSSLSLTSSREMELFLELVPARLRKELMQHEGIGDLIEVVLDLGRRPIARFPSGDWVVSEETVKREDLNHAISKVGDFSDDNRSGIDHSLHRISAIRNRKLDIIGLTCRFGRAISGTAEMVRDLIEREGSILVIGRPGVGKTTLIREIARMLADEHLKRVIIIDTSNEIGGDGDVPHSGIGRARRMQVPNVNLQHNVMIEAVENHMPETIIVDEIGTELEALAASTIAQRGVQLVGTAHGMTIDNIIKNPSLQILVGGIESVTLGDEEARKRKVQKTILERKGPPAFTCAVEMISKTEYRVHHRLDATVDAILAGKTPLVEVRRMDIKADDSVSSTLEAKKQNQEKLEILDSPMDFEADDFVTYAVEPEKQTLEDFEIPDNKYQNSRIRGTEKQNPEKLEILDSSMDFKVNDPATFAVKPEMQTLDDLEIPDNKYQNNIIESAEDAEEYPARRVKGSTPKPVIRRTSPVYVYTYKILEADLLQVAEVTGVEDEIDVTDDIGTADAILASSSELKQNPWIRSVAKFHKLPIFVIKANTMAHMVKAVRMILGMESFCSLPNRSLSHPAADIEIEDDAPQRKPSLEEIDALEEVRLAIEYIVIPGGEAVELLPRRSEIIDRQMELVESYQLSAEKSGTDLNARLQILPLKLSKKIGSVKNSGFALASQRELTLDPNCSGGGGGGGGGDDDVGGGTSVDRLPFLPE